MSAAATGDTAGRTSPIRPRGDKKAPAPGAGPFGMAVFLASLSMLFAGSLVAYGVIRWRSETWPPPGAPEPPVGLWLSTLLLVACSVSIHAAIRGARSGDRARLTRALTTTIVLGFAFLASQAWCWIDSFQAATFRSHLYGFLFYMLTVLHALHVLGGMVALGFVRYRAGRGAYDPAEYGGVRNCAIYWHFLDVVWLVLFGVLWFGG